MADTDDLIPPIAADANVDMHVTPPAGLEHARGILPRTLDDESRSWVARLNGIEPVRRCAIAELHEQLRREASFEIRKRARQRAALGNSDLDDLAMQAANDALMTLLRKLGEYRGDSQFLTWARRFAQLEAAVSIRRRLGHDRLPPAAPPTAADDLEMLDCSPPDLVEGRMLLQRVTDLIDRQLTQRQRTVLIAVAINGASAATVAVELDTTAGAIYKTLHDARTKLKAMLAAGD